MQKRSHGVYIFFFKTEKSIAPPPQKTHTPHIHKHIHTQTQTHTHTHTHTYFEGVENTIRSNPQLLERAAESSKNLQLIPLAWVRNYSKSSDSQNAEISKYPKLVKRSATVWEKPYQLCSLATGLSCRNDNICKLASTLFLDF